MPPKEEKKPRRSASRSKYVDPHIPLGDKQKAEGKMYNYTRKFYAWLETKPHATQRLIMTLMTVASSGDKFEGVWDMLTGKTPLPKKYDEEAFPPTVGSNSTIKYLTQSGIRRHINVDNVAFLLNTLDATFKVWADKVVKMYNGDAQSLATKAAVDDWTNRLKEANPQAHAEYNRLYEKDLPVYQRVTAYKTLKRFGEFSLDREEIDGSSQVGDSLDPSREASPMSPLAAREPSPQVHPPTSSTSTAMPIKEESPEIELGITLDDIKREEADDDKLPRTSRPRADEDRLPTESIPLPFFDAPAMPRRRGGPAVINRDELLDDKDEVNEAIFDFDNLSDPLYYKKRSKERIDADEHRTYGAYVNKIRDQMASNSRAPLAKTVHKVSEATREIVDEIKRTAPTELRKKVNTQASRARIKIPQTLKPGSQLLHKFVGMATTKRGHH